MDFQGDIDEVFFSDFAEDIVINGDTHKVLFERDLETVDDAGTVDMIEYALTAKKGVLQRNQEFTYLNESWKAARLLEMAMDGLYKVWEVNRA